MNNVKLPVTGLQHVGIPVTDIKRSCEFYTRLGFVKAMEERFAFDNDTGVCVMMQLDRIILELYQMPSHILPAIRGRADGHIDHIAFDVTDIDATFVLLKANGFHVIEREPVFLRFWKNGCRYFNITGPDGERLEFNQIL